MKPLLSNHEIEEFLQGPDFRLVYFASETCSVCKHMREEVSEKYGHKENMDLGLVMIDDIPEARGAYQVFSAPTIQVYFVGQQIYEASRFLRLEELDSIMKRIEELQVEK